MYIFKKKCFLQDISIRKEGNAMAKFDDFDLDVTKTTATENGAEPRITSKSLCTPGCVTGILMTCAINTATCGCQITGK